MLAGSDIFINNAIGGASAAKDNLTVTETSHETCMGLMESILGVSAECARVVIPLMIAGGGGSIVNVSSSTGVQPDVSRTYYGVAKAAVNMLTQQIAVQYGRQGIPVQCRFCRDLPCRKRPRKPCRKSLRKRG